MADRSLTLILAAGVRKANDMSLVTTGRGLIGPAFGGPVREPFAGAWQRNMEIREATGLMGYSPVYACVTRISGDIAKLGIDLLIDDEAEGISDLAPKTSPYWRVLRKPNDYQNRIQFIRHWQLMKLIFGNVYAYKSAFDGNGICTELVLLDPRSTRPQTTPDGAVYYSASADVLASLPNGAQAIPARLIIHDRGPTLWHPLVGIPPLFACALSGSLGLRIQQNSIAFFANMSRPSTLITGPNRIDPAEAARLKTAWEENYSAGNLGRTAILGDGLKVDVMSAFAEQSQLAEQLGISAVDVATAFGMPAYMINQGPMPTNNNVEALQQQYYASALQGNIEDLELCLKEGLALPDGYSVQFNLDGLLRMDSATQMDTLIKGVGGTIMSTDEARRKLNMRGVPGGSALRSQQQYYSLEALDARDKDEPFAKATPAAPAPSPAPSDDPAPKDQTKTLGALAQLIRSASIPDFSGARS